MLVGLSCKNAILLVELGKDAQGHDPKLTAREAVLEACRLRLRPIITTSIAFVLGVWPLVSSHGAGSKMRHAMGIAVFVGMIGVTAFGLLLAPVFFQLLRSRRSAHARPAGTEPSASIEGLPAVS